MTQSEFNPYVGPRPFERRKDDTARFFGRSHETEEIVSLIFGHPVTLIYAQSGAGKTSLFNASIVPNLEADGFDVFPLTRVGGILSQADLKEVTNLYMFNALLKMDLETDPQSLASQSLAEYLKTRPRKMDENDQPCPRAIIFDQFEELFTYTPENWREQRKGFFLQVVKALDDDPLLRVVFVIREDFLAELDPYARDLPERLRIRYRLERLGKSAALHAIEDPLAVEDPPVFPRRSFAPKVAEGLVNQLLVMKTVDATGHMADIEGRYVEPVQLQVACATLWSSLKPEVTEIQQSHLKNFNVSDALSEFYTSTIKNAARETGVREADLRNWFGKILITPMGTRSTVFRGDESTGGIDNKAVDFLEGQHIIRAEYRAGARWYELTHDRLVESVVSSNGDWFETLSPLQRQAALWNEKNREDSWLLSDHALVEVEVWAGTHKDMLTDTETDFLEACRKQQKEITAKRDAQRRELEMAQKLADEQTRSAQRIRKAFRVSIVIAGIASLLLVAAVSFGIQSYKNQQTTRIQVLTNTSAIELAEGRSESATVLAYQALKNYGDDHGEVEEALANIMQPMPPRESFQTPFVVPSNPSVYSIAFNPLDGGETFFAGYDDGNIFQVNVADHQPVGSALTGHTDQVTDLAFSPDGKMLASRSWDNTIILWDVKTHQQINQLGGQFGSVYSLAFGPDGKILASGGYGSVTFWDVESGEQIYQLSGHDSSVYTIAFSPDGKILASGAYNGTLILWDVASGQQIDQLNGHDNSVEALAFSPDGRILASVGGNRYIILWDVDSRQQIGQLPTEYTVNAVAFSPDGETIVSGDRSTIILWDVTSREPIDRFIHDEYISNVVAFSPDGKTIASAGYTSIVLWDVGTGQRIGDPITSIIPDDYTAVKSMSFSSSGDILAETDDELLLWNGQGDLQHIGTPDHELDEPGYYLESIPSRPYALSPDAEYKAHAYSSNSVRIADTKTNGEVRRLRLGESARAMAFSPDGNYIAAGGGNTVRIWDVESGKQIARLKLELETGPVHTLAFSPDGSRIVVAHDDVDSVVEIWDIQSGQKILVVSNRQQKNLNYAVVSSKRLLARGQQDNQNILDNDQDAQVGNRISDVLYSDEGLFILYENGIVDHWGIWPSRTELDNYAESVCGPCELTPSQRAEYGLYTWPMRVQDYAGYLIALIYITYNWVLFRVMRRVIFRKDSDPGKKAGFTLKKFMFTGTLGMVLTLIGFLTWVLFTFFEQIYYSSLETRSPDDATVWLLLLGFPLITWAGGAYAHVTRFQTGKWSRTKRSLMGAFSGFLGGLVVGFLGLILVFTLENDSFSNAITNSSGFLTAWTSVVTLAGPMSLFGALIYIFLLRPWSEGKLNWEIAIKWLRRIRFQNIPFKRGIMVTIIAGALLFLILYFEIGSIDPGSDILPVIGFSLVPGVFGLMFYPHKSSYILTVVLGGIGAFLWYPSMDSLFLSLWFGLGSGFVLSAIISRILHAMKKI